MAIALTLVTLRCVAHLNEYEADRWACEKSLKLPSHLNPPKSLSEAAEWFGAALRFVSGDGPSIDKSTWLHPSVSSRCARLRRWASIETAEPAAVYPSVTRRVEMIHCLSAKVRS
jgi:Zn-dependent protease with chaperone function